jgi:hypothetical protein
MFLEKQIKSRTEFYDAIEDCVYEKNHENE